MNVVDSSAWLEYFADGPNAGEFATAIENTDELLVPTIVIYEVFKQLRRQVDEATALRAVGQLGRGQVVDVDEDLAVRAADLSLELSLPMADSLILAAARNHNAILWTQDADFKGLDRVEFRLHAKTR